MSPLAISLRFLQTQPDERLVALARDGHERAFEALIRRYRSRLLAYCRRVAPRGTPPEDILQQGLLQAWRALSGGAEVRDARAWLYRIVHNVAITALRASGELPESVVPGAGAPGVDRLVEQRMAAREALAGLAALPDLQRQVMVSTALDGASHEEIAAALGLSSGSVRGLIYRARSTLRAAAAAVIPAPVIDWALGDAAATSVGIAGAGSAGLGALILKSSAVLAVGAMAGTAAVIADLDPHPARPAAALAGAARAGAPGYRLSAERSDRILLPAATTMPAGAGAALAARRSALQTGAARSPGSHDDSRGGSPGGRGSRQTSGGDGPGGGSVGSDGSSGGSGGGGGGSGGGLDGGGGGSSGGSGGGGDRQATTATSGSDGGGDHQTATSTTGSGGGLLYSSGSSGGTGS